MPTIVITKSGKVKDASWDAAKKQLIGNIEDYIRYVKDIKSHVDDNTINYGNIKEVRENIEQDYFNVETIKTKIKLQPDYIISCWTLLGCCYCGTKMKGRGKFSIASSQHQDG